MGGGGVDHLHVRVFNERDGLFCRRVGQAEKHQVGTVQKLAALLRVVPLVRVDAQQFNILPRTQPFVDLKAGGALLTVNIDFWIHMDHLILWCSMATDEGAGLGRISL